jgi:hypothetical protein
MGAEMLEPVAGLECDLDAVAWVTVIRPGAGAREEVTPGGVAG